MSVDNSSGIRSSGSYRLHFRQGRHQACSLNTKEKSDGTFSITVLSLEYIVLQLSSVPQGCIHTLGTLEVFFDFFILVEDVCMFWSPSPIGYHCGERLVFLASRVHETFSRSLAPPSPREIVVIVLFYICNPSVKRISFDIETMFCMFFVVLQTLVL